MTTAMYPASTNNTSTTSTFTTSSSSPPNRKLLVALGRHRLRQFQKDHHHYLDETGNNKENSIDHSNSHSHSLKRSSNLSVSIPNNIAGATHSNALTLTKSKKTKRITGNTNSNTNTTTDNSSWLESRLDHAQFLAQKISASLSAELLDNSSSSNTSSSVNNTTSKKMISISPISLSNPSLSLPLQSNRHHDLIQRLTTQIQSQSEQIATLRSILLTTCSLESDNDIHELSNDMIGLKAYVLLLKRRCRELEVVNKDLEWELEFGPKSAGVNVNGMKRKKRFLETGVQTREVLYLPVSTQTEDSVERSRGASGTGALRRDVSYSRALDRIFGKVSGKDSGIKVDVCDGETQTVEVNESEDESEEEKHSVDWKHLYEQQQQHSITEMEQRIAALTEQLSTQTLTHESAIESLKQEQKDSIKELEESTKRAELEAFTAHEVMDVQHHKILMLMSEVTAMRNALSVPVPLSSPRGEIATQTVEVEVETVNSSETTNASEDVMSLLSDRKALQNQNAILQKTNTDLKKFIVNMNSLNTKEESSSPLSPLTPHSAMEWMSRVKDVQMELERRKANEWRLERLLEDCKKRMARQGSVSSPGSPIKGEVVAPAQIHEVSNSVTDFKEFGNHCPGCQQNTDSKIVDL